MGHSSSLLRDALAGAHLKSELESEEFWGKSLGKNAKAHGVRLQYVKDYESVPLNKDVIFYETMSGARMGDNPYGIFEYLREHPEHGDFLHVWSVDTRAQVPPEYKDAPNVVFVRRNTRSYTYFLASAGYVICNANLPAFYIRRDGQKYLNTWHGVPYKSLGRNTPKARFGSPNGNSTFTKATHILTPGQFTSEKIVSAYSMKGVSNATIAEIGYPRVDRTLNADDERKARIRETLGLEPDEEAASRHHPTVLYAPTWRSENDKDVVDTEQLLDDLRAMTGPGIQLLYRGHHRMDRVIKDASVGDQLDDIIIPPHEISSNDLLAVVDVLITDFSSIFFDFLPTGKPIIHYLYDLDSYASTRGINLGEEELPGTVAKTRTELVEAINSVASDLNKHEPGHDYASDPLQGDRYASGREQFCPHDDGHASKRAVEFLLDDSQEGVCSRHLLDTLPTAVFWAAQLPSGPRAANFLESLLKSAASPAEQTVLVVERRAPLDKDFVKQIKAFGDDISTYSYDAEPPVIRPEEEVTYNKFATQYYMDFAATRARLARSSALKRIFAREYRRRLDDAKFDRVFLAADLTNEELALAYFAAKGLVTTANRWQAPSIQGTQELMPAGRAVEFALPHGSRRRKFVARTYRSLRKRLKGGSA
ncbi:CDP-glycerol glycerophosphotransferase family protein [Brevibacterium aurantiacum]|uniref:CDP-glycerol glycerophosphotransferase, TagB/SpsB family n=1 Tax=Brevibacterium aurantiacum TaxID=273384 RepID=A0A2A3X198_BREAU|nr:CDP-glycerol glycerophosphotransferase family protein [Brevibacterium aurantiacum]PCC17493.1 hypothetical protein CIK79_03825 [Brevibacterium aurantiacum]